MGRRQVVESANAALKGAFADLSRGFVRVFGVTKITALLGFTIAGYNLDRIRSFRAKKRWPSNSADSCVDVLAGSLRRHTDRYATLPM